MPHFAVRGIYNGHRSAKVKASLYKVVSAVMVNSKRSSIKLGFRDSERTLLPNIGRVPRASKWGKDVVLPGRSSQRRNMRAVTLLQLFINVIQVSGMRRIPHHRGVEFGLAHPMLLKHGLHVTVTFKVHAVPSRLCHGLCDVVIIKQIFQFLWLNQTGRYAGLHMPTIKGRPPQHHILYATTLT